MCQTMAGDNGGNDQSFQPKSQLFDSKLTATVASKMRLFSTRDNCWWLLAALIVAKEPCMQEMGDDRNGFRGQSWSGGHEMKE